MVVTTQTASSFRFSGATEIWSGLGCRRALAEAIAVLGLRRAVLVCSSRFRRSDDGEDLVSGVGDQIVEIYDGADGEPDVTDARRLANFVSKQRADGVVVVGGGSALGLAKCAVVDFASSGGLERFQWQFDPISIAPAAPALPRDLLPIIALPTTAGSGSEVNGFGSVRDAARQHKVAVRSSALAPRIALLDGELTASAPPRLTAGTGLNALSHCVESLYSRQAQPLSSAMAVAAAGLIATALPRCVVDGSDLEARQHQLVGSAMSSIAFSNAMLGLHGALCHALAVVSDVVYGDAQSVIFGRALGYRSELIEDATRATAEAMGLQGARSDSWRRLRDWADALGGPTRLRDIGVNKQQLPDLAAAAFADRCLAFDPRPADSPATLQMILEEAW